MSYKEFPVLYVDDEQANRVVMKHNLARDFTLLLAESGAGALELLATQHVAVLLADQRMPQMTGVDLAAQVRERYPDVVRVIITAYSDVEATIDAINRAHVSRFLKKPWTLEELGAVLRASIESYRDAQLLRQLQQRLNALDRLTALSVMGAAIAHDMRQPLTYLQLNLDGARVALHEAQAASSPAACRAALERVRRGLDDVADGIDRFRLISDSLLGALQHREPAQEPIDLCRVVHSAVALCRGTVERSAQLATELPDEEVRLVVSEGRVVQLIVNLLLNAAQACGDGGGVLRTKRVTVSLVPQDDVVLLSVADNGCGMDAEVSARIFTPLFSTKGDAGTGLGLAICKQIVEELGGRIAVESAVGQGTTFRVALPRPR